MQNGRRFQIQVAVVFISSFLATRRCGSFFPLSASCLGCSSSCCLAEPPPWTASRDSEKWIPSRSGSSCWLALLEVNGDVPTRKQTGGLERQEVGCGAWGLGGERGGTKHSIRGMSESEGVYWWQWLWWAEPKWAEWSMNFNLNSLSNNKRNNNYT